MGSTSTATYGHVKLNDGVKVKAQVDVHRTLAHLRQGPNPLIDSAWERRRTPVRGTIARYRAGALRCRALPRRFARVVRPVSHGR